MLTLYDFPFSGNGYKVRLLLRELGIAFVYREVNILSGETRLPWFLEKNPVGQIPVVELEDGTCLTESSAILFHLAQGTPLLPQTQLARTRALQWMCFEQTNIDGVISRARFRRRYPDVVPTRPEEFEAWWRDGYRSLDVLERHLSRHLYLVGNEYSIADIAVYAYVHRANEGGFDLSACAALSSWFARIEARPNYVSLDAIP
jgi:glutathione S-transferase